MNNINTNIGFPNNILDEYDTKARAYISASISDNTKKSYGNSLTSFVKWCEEHSLPPFPTNPRIIVNFLISQAEKGLKPNSIKIKLSALRKYHNFHRLENPADDETVKAVMRGIRRKHLAKVNKKLPLTVDRLKLLISGCNINDVAGLRDRALLLLGFAGALRRSELVAIKMDDIEYVESGIKLHIRKSKTDQEGHGQTIAIPYGKLGVIEALQEYLAKANIKEGYIFRRISKVKRVLKHGLDGKSVSNIIKKYAGISGFEEIINFSGHSLRAGFLTSAALAGADAIKMMEVSRHISFETTRGYIREANLFDNHAGSGFL